MKNHAVIIVDEFYHILSHTWLTKYFYTSLFINYYCITLQTRSYLLIIDRLQNIGHFSLWASQGEVRGNKSSKTVLMSRDGMMSGCCLSDLHFFTCASPEEEAGACRGTHQAVIWLMLRWEQRGVQACFLSAMWWRKGQLFLVFPDLTLMNLTAWLFFILRGVIMDY